jgi:hypothetical protein
MAKVNTWEEALNELVDEKLMIWKVLEEVVELWESDGEPYELENIMAKARKVMELTEPKETA